MPTNPRRYPQQHGNPGLSRAALYGTGMDVLRQTVQVLAQHGPVLVGGDMNSHPSDGSWAAAPKMTALGYGYAKDNGVMYLFYPPGVGLVSNSVVPRRLRPPGDRHHPRPAGDRTHRLVTACLGSTHAPRAPLRQLHAP